MASMIFSDDEAKYLRAVLKWQEKNPEDNRASWMLGLRAPKPVGEFRILVIGAKGVGKTSILKKFCTGVFPDAASLASSSNINGCRRNITIESNEGKHVESNLYTVDALELPVEHLSSPEHLSQALAITDAAVLVYDITDPASLCYLKSLANSIYSSIHPGRTTITPTKKKSGFHLPGSQTTRETSDATHNTRPYHFLLIGAKRDVPDSLREVSWLEGQIAAEEFFGPSGIAAGASVSFLEVSARTGEQVGAVFPSLCSEVLKSRRERQAASSQKYLSAQGSGGLSEWDISDFDHDADDTDDDGQTDGSGTMAGSVRRRWAALKASLAASIFKR
ncbi:hypothetical protein LA080_003777 [Diaporthe eres]|nr:hypothetical protein LA080_003777 [Diaporthe eres]